MPVSPDLPCSLFYRTCNIGVDIKTSLGERTETAIFWAMPIEVHLIPHKKCFRSGLNGAGIGVKGSQRTDTLKTKAEQGGQKQPRLWCGRKRGEEQRQVNSFEKITRRLNLILQAGRIQRGWLCDHTGKPSWAAAKTWAVPQEWSSHRFGVREDGRVRPQKIRTPKI